MVEIQKNINVPWTTWLDKKRNERWIALERLLANNPSLDEIFESLQLTDEQKNLVATRLVTYDLWQGISSYAPHWVKKIKLEDALKNTDTMDPEKRIVLAQSVLDDNGCSPVSWTEAHSQRILAVHEMPGEALVMDQEQLDAKRTALTKDGLFMDHQATVLLYNMVCWKAFWWGVAVMGLVIFFARQQWCLNTASYVPPPPPQLPEVITPKNEAEARKMVIDPAAITQSILAQSPDFMIITDTLQNDTLPWFVKIDPEKNSQWWNIHNAKRWIEKMTGMGDADYSMNSPYLAAVGSTGDDIKNRKREWSIDPNTLHSVVRVTGVQWNTIKLFTFTSDITEQRLDNASREDDNILRSARKVAEDSMASLTKQYLIPAATYFKSTAEASAIKTAQKNTRALFGTALVMNPQLIGHKITFVYEVSYEMPQMNSLRKDGPFFTTQINTSWFERLWTPGAKRIVTVSVTGVVGDPNQPFTGSLVDSREILPAPLKQ
jgi:hypothetical protein